jgi:hypothetical protein
LQSPQIEPIVDGQAYTVGMSSQIEVSPGGIGFIRTEATKSVPAKSASTGVQRRAWLTGHTTPKSNPRDSSTSKK